MASRELTTGESETAPTKVYSDADLKAISDLALSSLKEKIGILFDPNYEPEEHLFGLRMGLGTGADFRWVVNSPENNLFRDYEIFAGFGTPRKKAYSGQTAGYEGAVAPGLIWALINGNKPYLALNELESIFGYTGDLFSTIREIEHPRRRGDDTKPYILEFFERYPLSYQDKQIAPVEVAEYLLYTLASEGQIREAQPIYVSKEEAVTSNRNGSKALALKKIGNESKAKEMLGQIIELVESYQTHPAFMTTTAYCSDKKIDVGAGLQLGLLKALHSGARKHLTDREYSMVSDIFCLVHHIVEKSNPSFQAHHFGSFINALRTVLIVEGMQLNSPDMAGAPKQRSI